MRSENTALPGDRFVIKQRLGEGGMGVVYRAFDQERGADVALKSLRKIDGATLYRFKKEFRSLADLIHPNLVTLYELASSGSTWFFTMELVEGVSFLEYVRPHRHLAETSRDADETRTVQGPRSPDTRATRTAAPESRASTPGSGSDGWLRTPTSANGEPLRPERRHVVSARLDEARLRESMRQLATAVVALHHAGKLHRDLKPSNVLVDGDGRVVLCDFGLVAESREEERTEELRVAGTPSYMAPEQARADQVTEATDWYAVGVMLYEALTGRVPFSGDMEAVLELKRTTDPKPPLEWEPNTPRDLSDLAMALLARSPDDRPTGDEVLAALGATREKPTTQQVRRHSASFVGRSAELQALRAAFTDVRAGSSVSVFVQGPSGIGKTELCSRFLEELKLDPGTVVLQSRCYERETVPYKALDALIDALSNHLLSMPDETVQEVLPRDISSLSRLFPVLMRVRAVAEPRSLAATPPDPAESRRRAFGALRYLLRKLTEQRRVVLFIDDLQWGDMDSAPFFRELISHPEAPPLLWLATYRREEADSSELLRALLTERRRGDLREIALEPIGEADARALVDELLGSSSTVHADAILRESAGSPFLLWELAHAGGTGSDLRLDHVIETRLEQLPPAARALLEVIAVAGRPIALSVAAAAGNVADAPAALAPLRAGRLVRARRQGQAESIETYHDRIRETVTASLTPGQVRAVHSHIAAALERRDEPDPLALVEHWRLAGERAKAGNYAEEAAVLAGDALAFNRSAHYYELALELQEPSEERSRDLLRRIGDARANAGHLEKAADSYLAAAETAPEAESIELRRRAVEQLLRAGKREDGLRYTRDLLAAVGLKLPKSSRRALLSVALSRLWIKLRGYGFDERTTDEVPPRRRLAIDVCWSLSSGLSLVDPMLGTSFQMKHLLAALRTGQPEDVALALSFEISYRAIPGAPARPVCEDMARRARELAERIGDVRGLALSWGTSGVAAYLTGDWREANDRLWRGERMLRDSTIGMAWELDALVLFRMAALLYMGELRDLTRFVPLYLREAEESGNQYLATGLRSWRSNTAWLVNDDPDEAQRMLEIAEETLPLSGDSFHLPNYYRLLARVQIALYRGDARAAWTHMEEGWSDLQHSLLTRVQMVRIEGAYLRARAALAAASSGLDPERMLKLADKMARSLTKEKTDWGTVLAHIVRGCAAGLRRDEQAAQAAFGAAATLADGAHMGMYAAIARRRRAEVLGDRAGNTLIADTDSWFEEQRVGSADRLTALFAPMPGG